MVKHIILWQLKEMDEEEKQTVKKGIKAGLESLQGKIPGLLSIHVQTEGLPSSNADIMLDSSFENADALKGYATHPEHVKIADGNVRPYTQHPFADSVIVIWWFLHKRTCRKEWRIL